jgi:hypothetical protein
MLCAMHRGVRACRSMLGKRFGAGYLAVHRSANMSCFAARHSRDSLQMVLSTSLERLAGAATSWQPCLCEITDHTLSRFDLPLCIAELCISPFVLTNTQDAIRLILQPTLYPCQAC